MKEKWKERKKNEKKKKIKKKKEQKEKREKISVVFRWTRKYFGSHVFNRKKG